MTITLPTKLDLDRVYGASNIAAWADVDNDGSPRAREDRIDWAIGEGYRYVSQRISLRYDITMWSTLPAEVFSLVARRAGIELYTSPRGLVDGDSATQQLNAMSLAVEAKIDQILAGQLPLLDADAESIPISRPGVNNSTRLPRDGLVPRHFGQCIGEPRIVSDYSNFYVDQ